MDPALYSPLPDDVGVAGIDGSINAVGYQRYKMVI
jgi:hypothetical protein